MFTAAVIREHLIGMGHGSTLNKVRNEYALMERSASLLITRMKPIETMRVAALSSAVYDDLNNYALPSDYFELVDLIPQDGRGSWDNALRNSAGQFDLFKAIANQVVSIEGNNGIKIIRINWKSRASKLLNGMDSYDGNGTWSAVGSATDVATDSIFKMAGGGSVVLTHAVTGDGIKNTDMSAVDLSNEDGVGAALVWVYFSSVPTAVTLRWGTDVSANYWSGTVTSQADGSSFRVGWNQLVFSWAAAAETGSVDASIINAAQITFAGTALGKIRVDNLMFGIGRNFDIKYYSKYLFQTSSGTWESRPTSDDDLVLVDNDSLPHFLFEVLQGMAQQMEGSDAAFDIGFAEKQLMDLYPSYRGRYPSQAKKQVARYGTSKGFMR